VSPAELVAALREGMDRPIPGRPPADTDLVFTFVSPRATGLGVRPQILSECADGYVLGIDRKTAARWIKRLEREGLL
jgi:hypothetical protein